MSARAWVALLGLALIATLGSIALIMQGARAGETIVCGHDGIFVVDLERLRVTRERSDLPRVNAILHVGDALFVGASNGLHELDAVTLATRRTFVDTIIDAVVLVDDGRGADAPDANAPDAGAPIASARRIAALEHPGDDPDEAHGLHLLLLVDVASGEIVRRVKLPPDAHELVRAGASNLLHAPRKVGREIETVDLAADGGESVSHLLSDRPDAPPIVLMRTLVLARDGRSLYLFESEDERIFLWHLTLELVSIDRRELKGLPAYPRSVVARPSDGQLILACGREIVVLDPQDLQITARAALPGRIFDLALDRAGLRLLAVRPEEEPARGVLAILDAQTLALHDQILLPRRAARLSR